LTVAPSLLANGTLSDPNKATDGATIVNGVFTITGSAAKVTTALDAIGLYADVHQVAAGQPVTTTFTISDSNTTGGSTVDSKSAIIATATGSASNNEAEFEVTEPGLINQPMLIIEKADGTNSWRCRTGGNATSAVFTDQTAGFVPSGPVTLMSFETTSGTVADSATVSQRDAFVQAEFGPNAIVADWSDVVIADQTMGTQAFLNYVPIPGTNGPGTNVTSNAAHSRISSAAAPGD